MSEMSFWDHLDVLRGVLFRSAIVLVGTSVILFCFKGFLFDDIVLAPTRGDFFLYRWLHLAFSMSIINIEISAQFFIHLKIAFSCGLIISFPYLIYEVWTFIAPALYKDEKSATKKAFMMASVLFYLGVAVGYFFIVPVCLNFFANYSVSAQVNNQFTISSYISLFLSMVIMSGVLFEFPSVIAVLSHLGIVTRTMLKKGRKYAFCIILVISAAITPSDPVSMFVLAAPLYLLYEGSIFICKKDS